MKIPEEKYRSDPHYHLLVDSMVSAIEQAQFTPSEMREAAVFACYLHESRRPMRYFTDITPDRLNPPGMDLPKQSPKAPHAPPP